MSCAAAPKEYSISKCGSFNVVCYDITGATDGEEWGGQDQHEVYHICQLHCQGHQKTRSNQ